MDIGHAIYAANSLKKSKESFLDAMIQLQPKMFHFTDGNFDGEYDVHLHFGAGSFNFELIREILPATGSISIECPHDFSDNLDDFIKDSLFVKNLIMQKNLSRISFAEFKSLD